ncbi:hypothetical protein HD597_000190 [Nonomuraea thailandensis]|uniref:Uncharacterized protein n=1 Tax=Nonomuraea thailandensis TaxID=1188745 RepID=A0A9X2JYY5_9ACTN|nr:hypothetical protein [Nonomuraea thailandensis]MCP2353170.1 hypothetical protein [Nonomuraea thailandensis]
MKDIDLTKLAGPLIGHAVRVTATFRHRYGDPQQQVYEGTLLAIGQKQGNSRRNAMPYCLVINATATEGGVPIIAFRSVTSIEPLCPASQQHPHQPDAPSHSTVRPCRAGLPAWRRSADASGGRPSSRRSPGETSLFRGTPSGRAP